MALNPNKIALQWQQLWADNSNLDNENAGIISFAKTCFPDVIKEQYGTSVIHKEMYHNFLELYNPVYRFTEERQIQLKVFRGASKSTITDFICVTYVICFNGWDIILPSGITAKVNEDLIVLASETSTMAETWVNSVRGELSTNAKIKFVFGIQKPMSVKDTEGKWTAAAFTAQRKHLGGKNVTFMGRGVGQQIRGINIKGRPTLIIVDDPYSSNNTKTPESRQKVRYWYDAELMNSLDQNDGKSVTIGTVVHEDTIIVDNEKATGIKMY